MLTVSLHNIHLRAPIGVYEEERVLGNDFEVDVDLWLRVEEGAAWPFADYGIINTAARAAFSAEAKLLEEVAQQLHSELQATFPAATRIAVAVRKLRPPLPGVVGYAQVRYEG